MSRKSKQIRSIRNELRSAANLYEQCKRSSAEDAIKAIVVSVFFIFFALVLSAAVNGY